jgi:hypothetical protein
VAESKWRKPWIACQWLLVAAGVCLLVWTLVQQRPKLEYNRAAWHSWDGFVALSFTDISRRAVAPDVSPRKLAELLETLQKAGYQTITLEDAASFLAGEAPLPDKALLLLFEGARRETFLTVTPLLRRLGYAATLCLPTSYLYAGGRFYLSEEDLKRVIQEPHWQLASMGHRAISRIPLDEQGTEGHFLTRRIWSGNRLEEERDFLKRVADDYLQAIEVFQRIKGDTVPAYLFPYADAGQSRLSDPLAYEINYKAVSSLHRMAFLGSREPFNGPASNPHSLTRLRVSAEWNGGHLLAGLEQARVARAATPVALEPEAWKTTEGVAIEGGQMKLDAGAIAWLRGSDGWSDLEVKAVLEVGDGGLGALHARHDGPRSYVSLTIGRERLALMQKTPGNRATTLARAANIDPASATQKLRLRIRGNRAWFSSENETGEEPTPLSGVSRYGLVGLACLEGSITIRSLEVNPIRPSYIVGRSFRNLTASERETATTLVPYLSSSTDPVGYREFTEDVIAAAATGVFTAPLILNQEGEPASAWLALLQDPLVKPLIQTVAVAGTGDSLAVEFRKAGYAILRIVSTDEALAFAASARPGKDKLILQGTPSETAHVLERLRYWLPPERLVAHLPEGNGRLRVGTLLEPLMFDSESRP